VISDDTRQLYLDVVAAGGLGNALQAALAEVGSRLQTSELNKAINFVVYARVELHPRFSQVYIGAKERLFIFDCWSRGVMLAQGSTPCLDELARAIDRWVASDCTVGALSSEFGFVRAQSDAGVYERGEEVAERWRDYLSHIGGRFPELAEFVRAAAARPELRRLFPFTSLNTFWFSRCTGYPFTRDTPYVRPMPGGGYEVAGPDGRVLGRGHGEEAAELVIRHLPPGCGPAVAGTADDLKRAEPNAAADKARKGGIG
jgi:hypothetical protein